MGAVKQDGRALNYVEKQTEEMKRIKAVLEKIGLKPYYFIRYQLVNQEIVLDDSPYHVLEQLYGY